MKNWFWFYKNNIQNWDILIKLPLLQKNADGGLIKFFPKVDKIMLETVIKNSSEVDFKVIKMASFFVDLFDDENLNIFIRKQIAGNSSDKLIKLGVILRKSILNRFLAKFSKFISLSFLKKQVPYTFGIDDKGIIRITLKDIGELGIKNMRYDYFGWQDTLAIILYFNINSLEINNLVFSYVNMKFVN